MKTLEIDRRKFLTAACGAVLVSSTGTVHGQTSGTAYVPPRAIGVNCFDLFYGPLISDPSSRMAVTRMRELRTAEIPFVRFAASPFWPIEWKLYTTDRQRYFSLLDAVVKAAEDNHIGLVLSLFWNPVTISDLVGEPASDWGRDGSKTRSFMAKYVEQVVSRYRKSSAIWLWEFGNEFNTYADLPNGTNWWPKVNIAKQTPATRGPKDLITSRDCNSAFKFFATEVRKHDRFHLITTGADLPRPNAYNLSIGKYQVDTAAEFRSALLRITPAPLDVISIHLYQKAESAFKPASYMDILSEVVSAGAQGKKFTFVGEFGVPRLLDATTERREFERMLSAIVNSRVNWASMWVFDFSHQQSDWNVQQIGDRAYQLKLIAAANKNL